jgi:GR25 family glycosyltransferase involved in LPS biosynthesis
MEFLENTYYINLEERTDRLLNVQNELKKIGIEGKKLSAIKMKDGAVGCTFSHIKCLEQAKENGFPYVFICEDDIHFTNPNLLMENLDRFSKSGINWDVIVIGGNNAPPYKKTNDFCIQVLNIQTTTGYIVKQHYYDKLIQNFKEGLGHLLRNPQNKREFAIDIYWKRLQQDDKWFMIIPPTVTQYEDYSNIENQVVNYDRLMLDLDKEWLYRRAPHMHSMSYVLR